MVLTARYFFISITPLLFLRRVLNKDDGSKVKEEEYNSDISMSSVLLFISRVENKILPNLFGGSLFIIAIPFNKPPYTGNEEKYVLESMRSSKISGDGEFTKRCHDWFEDRLQCKKALLTTSCTHALEMAAILLDIKEGDEVIMPSYTANAFVLRGAKIVFAQIL